MDIWFVEAIISIKFSGQPTYRVQNKCMSKKHFKYDTFHSKIVILNNCNKSPCNRFQKVSKSQTSIMNVVKYIYLSQHVPSYAVLCMHDWLKLIITNKYIFQFRTFVSSEKCQSNLLRQFRGSNAYSPRPALVYVSFGFKQL